MTRYRIQITGIVQGVGFRPFVWQSATKLGLVGWVLNDSAGVTIEVQGDQSALDQLCDRIRAESPPLARIDSFESQVVTRQEDTEFLILESIGLEHRSTPVSPDVSICNDCKSELFDDEDRRYLYPFINCTNCGPRFTIVEDIPYDRPNSTMKSFPMCDQCQAEYDDPSNRRFHAQPNACPECGPVIWLEDTKASAEDFDRPNEPPASEDVVHAFKTAIYDGKIIAVKGIGGFHLACDATNEAAVSSLRERKGRIDKPFAVMVGDVKQAKTFATVSNREQQILESRERPIVLLNKRGDSILADNVAPKNNFIGVMLPYSPLHWLLVDERPLLLTSGNLSDEPIVRTNNEAKDRLGKLADAFLLHDREIHVVCDDSVVRNVDDELLPIRRSRGYSPMPIRLDDDGTSVLAVGGEIKSTFCLTKSNFAYMSQHIGDMGNAETLSAMQSSVEHFVSLFRAEPQAIAADMHPDYLSGQWAELLAKKLDIPIIRVQHHFAHVVSLIVEHGLKPDQKIIGCCFDGTGFGTDQTIWGGEFLVADTMSFNRVAALESFPLPGGDASIHRPARVALSLLWRNRLEWDDSLPPVQNTDVIHRKLLMQQLVKNLNCISTSSMGRLFDAVAALIGVRQEVNYEAQAAMEMEALAAKAVDTVRDGYSFEFAKDDIFKLGTGNLINSICEDLSRATPQAEISAKFHYAVANAIGTVCKTIRAETGIETVGLTGGVFQNILLLRLSMQNLQSEGFRVLTHCVVPPNDGGIALGQAVVARNWLESRRAI